jgi:D-beta-D-heptose 7-phosphate kinase/D-beta-D-heptose 1-phosphate adenosyltransferase
MSVIVVSGYFNPIHKGHIEYFKLAKEYAGDGGKLYVIVNNDKQNILKKNFTFVPEDDRLEIVKAIRYVDDAVLSIDEDRTVCKTLESMVENFKPTHFANGGDVTKHSPCPEEVVCKKYNIELVYGLGDKIQSSSWIIEKLNNVKLK